MNWIIKWKQLCPPSLQKYKDGLNGNNVNGILLFCHLHHQKSLRSHEHQHLRMPRCPANQWNVLAIEKVAVGQGLEGCLATRNFLGKRASSRTIGHQRKKIGVVGGGGVKKTKFIRLGSVCIH